MRLRELDLPSRYIQKLEGAGYDTLFPPQEQAVHVGLLGDRNMVLAIPTASGKTLIALLAVIKALQRNQKAVYIVPLKALAEEKYQDMKELGINVALTTGDYDSANTYLKQYDVVVTTSEKCDSLLRHDVTFFDEVHLVVADEVHLLDDPGRGPTLEMILSKMKGKRILALSATISNASDLAQWLDAELVTSEWRPVPLRKGVFHEAIIVFEDGPEQIISHGDPCVTLAVDSLKKGQVLFFVNTRKSTQAVASRIARSLKNMITCEPLHFSDSIYRSVLQECSLRGVSFHHAGLKRQDRLLIEEAFKANQLKVLVATPTLAAGINLPARRVVVRDVKRFYQNLGYYFIPTLEIQQMMGRAGRPRYDSEGEAILVAKNQEDVDQLFGRYIFAEPERISSKLASQPALRTHLLALMASDYMKSEEDLRKFFSKTLYVHQNGEEYVYDTINQARDYLERHNLVQGFEATPFGRRVSQLYIDPASAVVLRQALQNDMLPIGILHAVSACPDMPGLYLRRGDFSEYDLLTEEHKESFLLPIPDTWEEPELYEIFLSQVKTASLLSMWVEEVDEKEICTHFSVGPGDLYRMREAATWLLYSFGEIARLFSHPQADIRKLRVRLKYGIKEELLPLVRIKNIGRVRARSLYDHGFETLQDIKKASLSELESIVGEGIARSVLDQLAGNVD
ncbi:MAG: DEAD/DEAH box helicase [Theionarchaea archaeon]|nr:DEAD/DEAH box helicase [Theionarchaea archaeon]MBU7022376.1 DEAD/DEAH box helicase [Theionarchaea archaeon]MBU7035091.1 DEAD/DEAH box helicase [Theionarchaea archaeon]MBU7040689.1 DEAD/DEAH box helicase [Theionarchaea archaeon]